MSGFHFRNGGIQFVDQVITHLAVLEDLGIQAGDQPHQGLHLGHHIGPAGGHVNLHGSRVAVDEAVVDHQLGHIVAEDIGVKGGDDAAGAIITQGASRRHCGQAPLIRQGIVVGIAALGAFQGDGIPHGHGLWDSARPTVNSDLR